MVEHDQGVSMLSENSFRVSTRLSNIINVRKNNGRWINSNFSVSTDPLFDDDDLINLPFDKEFSENYKYLDIDRNCW